MTHTSQPRVVACLSRPAWITAPAISPMTRSVPCAQASTVPTLVCAIAALKAAYETNALALEQVGEPLRSLLTATENSLEKGVALAEAVLEGLEAP